MEVDLESKWIEDKRKIISDVLEKTKTIDFPSEKNDLCIRFYKMTKDEYVLSKNSCFKIIFGTTMEGYCYDFRQLMNDGYLYFDQQICQLPILLSGNRWNEIIKLGGIEVLKKICKRDLIDGNVESGIICWPLFQDEKSCILRNLSKSPTISSYISGYEISFNQEIQFRPFYDKSIEERFFPDWQSKKIKDIEASKDTSIFIGKYEKVKEILKSELIQLGIYDLYQKKLNEKEIIKMATDAFACGSDETQVYSIIFRYLLLDIFATKNKQ